MGFPDDGSSIGVNSIMSGRNPPYTVRLEVVDCRAYQGSTTLKYRGESVSKREGGHIVYKE